MFNSWRVFLQTTCAVALIAAASLVSAQDFKIGVVNPERLLRESTPARAALQKLEAEFSKRQKDVEETGSRLKVSTWPYTSTRRVALAVSKTSPVTRIL